MIVAGIAIVTIQRQRPVQAGKRSDDKSLEQVNVLVRELVHEIRNPLNSINLNLELLEEDLSDTQRDPDDLQQRVRRVRGEVGRLDRILTDFRRYAKLPPLTLETCDLARLIEEVLDFNEPEAQKQEIQVIRELQELYPIELDREQFKQALLNLIINANQAMEDGGKLIVRAKPLNGQIQIDVEDTGKGIPLDRTNKIFDLFFSTKEDGTGVGLTIVKQVIEAHDGHVNVDSKLDHGTTFSILLPVKTSTRT